MDVIEASAAHSTAFVALAGQVEHWFGPMVGEPGFHRAVQTNIDRGTALVAIDDGDEVVGGLLLSAHPPRYEIGWLVVDEAVRSTGIGVALLAEALRRWVRPPAEVTVVTFGSDHPAARFRGFYERLGFEPAEAVEVGPEGGSRQRFRLHLETLPSWAE